MKDVKIWIDKLYKYDLKDEACSVAVPFAEGELKADEVSSLTVDGRFVQAKPTALWPDGTVKYLYVDFLADIPANKSFCLTMNLNNESGSKKASNADAGDCRVETSLECNLTDEQVTLQTDYKKSDDKKIDIFSVEVTQHDDSFTIFNGAVEFTLKNNSNSIFASLSYGSKTYLADQFVGPILGYKGHEYGISIEKWTIISSGPVKLVALGEGCYNQSFRFTVRITAWAGKEYLDLSFRLFNDTMEELIPDCWNFYIKRRPDGELDPSLNAVSNQKLDSTGCGDMNKGESKEETLSFQTTGTGNLAEIEKTITKCNPRGVRTLYGISNYKTRFAISGSGDEVSGRISADFLISEANEHFAEVHYGTFMADVTDSNGGLCATVFQAQQNFPKAIKADAEGLYVYLIPQGEDKVLFSSGMARTQRVQLHFHDAEEPIEMIDNRSLIYQTPICPYVAPELFKAAKVFPDIVSDFAKANDDVELALIAKADSHGRAYGMMNWGDFPDSNYTAQGRGGGRLVWTNNEYDYPHAMFMMHARTGVRRFLDYAKVAAWHWMDVDVCHYSTDSLRIGGQWEHTAGHNGGSGETSIGVMVCSHEWVEGLLDLWHFTGDEEALTTAMGIGENVLRLLDTPMYQKAGEANARETGWALRTLVALYLETNDKKWLGKCEMILDQFKEWRDKYGAWLAPYTDNTVIRVGFMISVALGSIMRYYRVFPDDELKKMMLTAVDDLVQNFQNPYGLFYYKELPSLQRNGNNTLLLEAMYIGYELTGDKSYLEAGLRTFWANIRTDAKYEGTKRIAEDAVLVGASPTKNFAQSFLPLVQFYNAAVAEGLV